MDNQQHRDHPATITEHEQSRRHTERRAGILHWASTDITWLQELLRRNKVTCEPLPLPNECNWRDMVMDKSLCVILYHSQKSHRSIHHMQQYVDYCKSIKDSNDMLIICDKEPDIEFTKYNRNKNLLIITEEEINSSGLIEPNTGTTGKNVTEPAKTLMAKVRAIQDLLQDQERSRDWENKAIGIFSRSDDRDYSWLRSLLHNTRPCYISNNGYLRFREDVSQCTFGILYHTKNRGRINVTDVTDSLYDEELKHLSSELGQKNVIVVIDDLTDSSDAMKTKIQENQPSIGRRSRALFLFSEEEKTPECIDYIKSHREVNKREVTEKLDKILNFIKPRGSPAHTGYQEIAEEPHDINILRRDLIQRIDTYKLGYGYTRILLQIFGFQKSDGSSIINSFMSALTNEPQGKISGSSVLLRGVISMMDNTEYVCEGYRFYLQLGHVTLDGDFQETFGNVADKILRAKQNGDLCVPIFISREQTTIRDLKKTLQEKNIDTGLPPIFILNKTPAGNTRTAPGDKDIKVIDLGREPGAISAESLGKDGKLLNILKEVLDNVDKKLQAPLDKEEEHRKLQVALLTAMHEIFMQKNNKENKSCSIL
ncbi:uncharacterized protein LOC134945689 [Pseudophryne corroboree]|uniref:uncharacterized protein LOC134945689 n=1 Tax=Pseudophryne corroboree TaxID=495146 RepID=UPI0030816F58